MKAQIEQLGGDLLCRCAATHPPENRLEGAPAQAALETWAARYGSAVNADDAAALLGIGREMHARLDESGWATGWVQGVGTRALEIQVTDPNAALGRALLDAPWELLATKEGHLADDAVQVLELVRRIGDS